MQVDERDLEVLRLLQGDAKASAREIGRRVGSPITTVYSRVKRLEDSGVIKGYKAVLDAAKLGRPTTAFILASFAYRTPGLEEPLDQRRIAREVARLPEVQEVHIIAGDWDILIKVKARDVAAIGGFVVDKLRNIRGIERTLTCMVFDTAKETLDIPI
ncbi:AsnC family transcriptional regulator [miscellaneous Crenarchaeota group-15 archaeon DG-45]|uniref:AsnC family transcriptional regulator n=1 Tax=miscellaneous Crenarchaeota group-15 archaeon DG-45 TaxID=1685127 RepID=A0A0M0BS69_9ARCH|nr:MAG: AsnC family transcriptional regulator [miscellaneous Crenarchaeota group-15 archaeon DG-45]